MQGKLLIGGKWLSGGGQAEVRNKYSGQPIGTAAVAARRRRGGRGRRRVGGGRHGRLAHPSPCRDPVTAELLNHAATSLPVSSPPRPARP